ncbi:uncharacterized protein DUF4280 [Allofrancisella inopinata]|uniref:DUF4280 domain-containing protein n=1 Tax=Allofrancisella inopinata TaxID=1085647 RepID=A0AAE6YIR2_9GAMM|nr:DUF4280 domain-containing protein [Allofrancisella inopinata]QIV96428.1 DUF4280 domain-containing protein [Allofrancisella inopinata]TDT73411.1 uncharacterized protein DUF4280 [Allofrancisella inopinata]
MFDINKSKATIAKLEEVYNKLPSEVAKTIDLNKILEKEKTFVEYDNFLSKIPMDNLEDIYQKLSDQKLTFLDDEYTDGLMGSIETDLHKLLTLADENLNRSPNIELKGIFNEIDFQQISKEELYKINYKALGRAIQAHSVDVVAPGIAILQNIVNNSNALFNITAPHIFLDNELFQPATSYNIEINKLGSYLAKNSAIPDVEKIKNSILTSLQHFEQIKNNPNIQGYADKNVEAYYTISNFKNNFKGNINDEVNVDKVSTLINTLNSQVTDVKNLKINNSLLLNQTNSINPDLLQNSLTSLTSLNNINQKLDFLSTANCCSDFEKPEFQLEIATIDTSFEEFSSSLDNINQLSEINPLGEELIDLNSKVSDLQQLLDTQNLQNIDVNDIDINANVLNQMDALSEDIHNSFCDLDYPNMNLDLGVTPALPSFLIPDIQDLLPELPYDLPVLDQPTLDLPSLDLPDLLLDSKFKLASLLNDFGSCPNLSPKLSDWLNQLDTPIPSIDSQFGTAKLAVNLLSLNTSVMDLSLASPTLDTPTLDIPTLDIPNLMVSSVAMPACVIGLLGKNRSTTSGSKELYVVSGAKVKCSFGSSEMPLNVLPTGVFIEKLAPTLPINFIPYLNIPSFGTCKNPMHPVVMATGMPQPCIPIVSPWLQLAQKSQVKGLPVVRANSCSYCIYTSMTGKVTISNPGQKKTVAE